MSVIWRVICTEDGFNNFGTGIVPVKKGEIYHVLSVDTLDSTNSLLTHTSPYHGVWYKLVEVEGWHWSGIFREVSWEEDIEMTSEGELILLNK